ncbi:uncharacterized protein EI97DRAFT_438180 [Westerdykella ornata]|uniref:Probable double zinc ribbon domain-containing protein n=1 Tax=Westerdykella ornata TaxID=318751 RepID=A0A6A6JVU0_WESOR|nr:uncharacterized protein EI97DRAFT_438180 [Westerdykella ornata]KAF2280730.1 hypothetical protein EI97DRAFT_438180 [Westerdykella ornata]
MSAPMQGGFSADSSVPKQQTDSHCAASMHTPRYPSPIGVSADSFWECQGCGVANAFEQTNRVRPLGRCRCKSCGAVITSLSQTTNVDVTPMGGMMFMVSLPADRSGPPQSLFGSVCCNCGRSHLRERIELAAHSKASQSQGAPNNSLRKKIWKAYRKIKDGETDEAWANEADDSFPERKAFTVKFDKPCCCGHIPCMRCPKFKVAADGEWVTQVREVETPSSDPNDL